MSLPASRFGSKYARATGSVESISDLEIASTFTASTTTFASVYSAFAPLFLFSLSFCLGDVGSIAFCSWSYILVYYPSKGYIISSAKSRGRKDIIYIFLHIDRSQFQKPLKLIPQSHSFLHQLTKPHK
jgi:hypothetical protein